MSSLGGTRAMPMYGLIGAAKGALESMTPASCPGARPRGINVNCLCAGLVDTGALSSLPNKEAIFEARRARSLVGANDLTARGTSLEFCCSWQARFADKIQGQTIVMDGGTSIQV
jgi:enoyl-[acyl-carrier-protein] reductase (NADH)